MCSRRSVDRCALLESSALFVAARHEFAALVQDEVGNLHLNTSALAPGSTVLVNGVDVLGFLAEHEQVLWMHEELLRELRTTVLALGQDVDALKGSSSTTAAPGSTQADPAATAVAIPQGTALRRIQ